MITRSVTPVTANTPVNGNCLGCSDCKGGCWSAFELATLPSVILKSKDKQS